jgi:type II secretory pathway component GspD/PulD (secretin)
MVALLLLMTGSSIAQTVEVQAKPLSDNDIKLLREDLQSVKDQVITNTMQLSEVEAKAFWPVYREYAQEQRAIADKRFGIITDYAQNLDKMGDAKASSLTKQFFQTEDEAQALRQKYFLRFEKALGAKRAAKFYQVDNRLTLMVNTQLASEVPLIP